jgi:hypothetical protein
MNNRVGGNELPPPPSSRVVSSEIFAREPLSNAATVKHILLSWGDLARDPRGAKRTKAVAEQDVTALLAEIKGGANFDELMKKHSEDSGSASIARPYKVTPDAGLVIEFRQLALRLHVDEVGVCETEYGFHIIKRID